MDISKLCTSCNIRILNIDDVDITYSLALGNSLYYKHCPPPVTRQSIINDMQALPTNVDAKNKYYLGFFFAIIA